VFFPELVQAPRDWLALFPFLDTCRPDTYGALVESARVSSV
jgi:hypothetical protein